MKQQAKVSIVLPSYNGASYLKQSIDSCLAQTHKNIELIIVNDGSYDDTEKIVKSYNDLRITYLKSTLTRGISASLNKGFSKATGEYLTWTSDDNYYVPTAIEKMFN